MSETAAMTPGLRLRTAREAKGLSTQTAADALHLDAWVIEALEQGDYVRIGPPVYARGHLKHYAAMLGLPVPEVLEAYEPQAATEAGTAARPAAIDVRTGPPAERGALWAKLAGALIILGVAAGLARWQPWHGALNAWRTASGAKTANVAPIRATATTVATGTTDAAEMREGTGATDPSDPTHRADAANVLDRTPAAESAATFPVAGSGPVRLRLRFSADSWVDVRDAAGRRLFAGNGRANSVKTIAGDAPMKVYLGFASGVQLEVNDHAVAIGPQFMAGDVARFEAGADGVLRRDPRTSPGAHPRG